MAKKKAETTEIEITPEQIAAEQRAIRENRASKAIFLHPFCASMPTSGTENRTANSAANIAKITAILTA